MKQKIEDYQVEASDDKNYTVSKIAIAKEGKHEGEEVAHVIGYYNSIESAVKEVARRCANERGSLKEWLAEYKAVIQRAESLLS